MKRIRISNPPRLNHDLLHEQLGDELGELYRGFSTDFDGLLLFLRDDATAADIERARDTVRTHDHTQQSTAQKEEADRLERIADGSTHVNGADIRAILNTLINDATLDPAVRTALIQSVELIGHLAHAIGLDPSIKATP